MNLRKIHILRSPHSSEILPFFDRILSLEELKTLLVKVQKTSETFLHATSTGGKENRAVKVRQGKRQWGRRPESIAGLGKAIPHKHRVVGLG